MPAHVSTGEIAKHVGGEVVGDPNRPVSGVGTPADAGSGDLTFVDGVAGERLLRGSAAGAVLAAADLPRPSGMVCIVVSSPRLAMAVAIDLIHPATRTFTDVSQAAHVEPDVELGADVGIGPTAWIGSGVRIGARTEIHPGATVGRGVTIGHDCIVHAGVHIYPGVTIGHRVIVHSGAVLGADGFGFVPQRAPVPGASVDAVVHRKIRQLGRVIIEDDVEIGANTTIDRASLGVTRVGRGTKIDNLVMVGHNSTIGAHGILVGQVGLSGSVTLDHHVTIGGQAGLADHVAVGAGATIGAQAGVTHDIAAGATVLGSPAIDVAKARRALPLIKRLPDLRMTLHAHRRRLERLEAALGADQARSTEDAD